MENKSCIWCRWEGACNDENCVMFSEWQSKIPTPQPVELVEVDADIDEELDDILYYAMTRSKIEAIKRIKRLLKIDPTQLTKLGYIKKSDAPRACEIDEDMIGFIIYTKLKPNIDMETLKDNWTARHFQGEGKIKASEIAKGIVSYALNPIKLKPKTEEVGDE